MQSNKSVDNILVSRIDCADADFKYNTGNKRGTMNWGGGLNLTAYAVTSKSTEIKLLVHGTNISENYTVTAQLTAIKIQKYSQI